MNKIKLITEAYATQPSTFEVKEKEPDGMLKSHYLKCIELEKFDELINGKISQVAYYVGYNWNDKIIFKYHQQSVNVHYFEE